MLITALPADIFADSYQLYADALEMLELGKIRNAAEKAWGATKRATDSLLLARTGEIPEYTSQTSRGIRALSRESAALESLRQRYFDRMGALHGNCFYEGDCEPEDLAQGQICATADYIRDAETAASS